MPTVSIKKNDTQRYLTDTLLIDSLPIDLTGATIKSIFRKGTTVVEQTGNAVGDATLGKVQCAMPSAVATVSGTWSQEWELTYIGGKQLTVPTQGYNQVVVNQDLNG